MTRKREIFRRSPHQTSEMASRKSAKAPVVAEVAQKKGKKQQQAALSTSSKKTAGKVVAAAKKKTVVDEDGRKRLGRQTMKKFFRRAGAPRASDPACIALGQDGVELIRRVTNKAMRIADLSGRCTILGDDVARALEIEGIHFC